MTTISVSGYVMLGMLSNGNRSGYEIKRSAELSVRHFWSISPPQIYQELAKLETLGLVSGSDEPHGNRPRRVFALTPAGRMELQSWLLRDMDAELGLRDLYQLKLFFADALEPAQVAGLVEQMRRRSEAYLRMLQNDVLPAIDRSKQRHAVVAPRRIADLHVELHHFLADWCTRIEAELAHGPAREGPSAT